MHFAFTPEQILFADAFKDVLVRECPPSAVRSSCEELYGRIPGLWEIFAETGLLGVLAPELYGGLGMSTCDVVLLLEELGYAGCPEPVSEHAAIAIPILCHYAPQSLAEEWLGKAVDGSAVLAAGSPTDAFVLAADRADLALLCTNREVYAIPASTYFATVQSSVDRTRRLFRIDWLPSEDTLVCSDPSAVQELMDRGALAAAAQAVGVGRRLLDMTVTYVAEREQFGKPVGTNQAVKHQCSNVAIALEFAAPMVYKAAWVLSHGEVLDSADISTDVSMAKAVASDAVDLACRVALQCHGAMGYTNEYDLQLWLKRGWSLSASWGDAAYHRQKVGTRLLTC